MTRGFIDGEYQDGEVRGLIFLVGDRGFGKTTELARLLRQGTGGSLFFDSLSKHGDVLREYRTICQPGELREYLRVNRGRRFQIRYEPRGGDLNAHFRSVCLAVRAFGWMIFGVDEVDQYCTSGWGDRRMPPELYRLVHFGRHDRVSMIATAREISGLAPGFRNQADVRAFRISGKSNVEFFADKWGRDAAMQLSRLEKYYYMRRPDGGEAEICGGPRKV